MKLSVFTAMMPKNYSPEETIKIAKSFNLDGIEWDFEDSYNIDFAKMCKLSKLTREAGLEIPSYSSGLRLYDIDGHTSAIKTLFKLAQETGVNKVRFWSSSSFKSKQPYLQLLEGDKLALKKLINDFKPDGIKIIIEIHFGRITSSPSNSYRLIKDFNPSDVGIIFDPGNMIVEGMEIWKMGMEVLGPYLAHVHVKNLVWKFDPKRRTEKVGENGWYWDWASLGEGQIDWRRIIADLKDVGYEGYLSSEDFGSQSIEEKLGEFTTLAKFEDIQVEKK